MYTTTSHAAGATGMKDSKELCWSCRTTCQETLIEHCLEMGGDHVEKEHVKLMLDCIQICQVAADFMGRNSGLHAAVCTACAEICEACADSCDALEGEAMKNCAKICRQCAASCSAMAQRH